MKKIYKAPGLLVVNIRTNHMLAESLMFRDGDIEDENLVLTREYDNTFSDKSVWEEKW